MPERSAERDGDLDHQGDGDHYDPGDEADGGADRQFPDSFERSRDEGDLAGGGADLGEGLPEPERELADELERRRGLEAARHRLERLAGDGTDGRRGGSLVDRDALGVIAAARDFGVDEDTAEAEAERLAITDALLEAAQQPPPDPSVHTFAALISKQETRGTSIVLTLRIPWEHRDAVFRAMETMPFSAMVSLT